MSGSSRVGTRTSSESVRSSSLGFTPAFSRANRSTPAGVDLLARLKAGVKPSELERTLSEELRVPTRDEPDISLEEVYADGVVVRIRATPVNDSDGARLADEILAVVTKAAADSPTGAIS